MRRLTGQGNVQGDPPAGGRDEEGDLKSAQKKKKSAQRANLYNLGDVCRSADPLSSGGEQCSVLGPLDTKLANVFL